MTHLEAQHMVIISQLKITLVELCVITEDKNVYRISVLKVQSVPV
jgi:hypothetical protein